MTKPEYKLIPLEKTRSIVVDWVFTQVEYDELAKGYRSNWCVFLRDKVVHICRFGGEEFYRFSMVKSNSGSYVVKTLESYITDSIDIEMLAVEETAGLLNVYFGITLNSKV